MDTRFERVVALKSCRPTNPLNTSMSVAADKIVFSMAEQTGNIWMKDLP